MKRRAYLSWKLRKYHKKYKQAKTILFDILDAINFVGFEDGEPDYIMVNTGDIELSYGGHDRSLLDIIPFVKEDGEFTKDDWNKIVKLTAKEP